jgi:hypothetical protein
VARIGAKRIACRVLVGESEGKRTLVRPRRDWKINIKMDIKNSRFYRVLTMVYNTQNCWGFGLYPSSGF